MLVCLLIASCVDEIIYMLYALCKNEVLSFLLLLNEVNVVSKFDKVLVVNLCDGVR